MRPFSAASLSRWFVGAPPWGSSLFQNGHAVPHGPSSSNRHLLPSRLDGRKQFLIFLSALSRSSLETPLRGLPSESPGNDGNRGFRLGVDHLLSGLCCCGCTFFFRDAQTCTMDPHCCANLSPATSGSGFLVCSIWDTQAFLQPPTLGSWRHLFPGHLQTDDPLWDSFFLVRVPRNLGGSFSPFPPQQNLDYDFL